MGARGVTGAGGVRGVAGATGAAEVMGVGESTGAGGGIVRHMIFECTYLNAPSQCS